jgi:hypothetical protein
MSEKANVASGDEFVPLQVGSFGTSGDEPPVGGDEGPGRAGNAAYDQAQVGVQADTVHGPVNIQIG